VTHRLDEKKDNKDAYITALFQNTTHLQKQRWMDGIRRWKPQKYIKNHPLNQSFG